MGRLRRLELLLVVLVLVVLVLVLLLLLLISLLVQRLHKFGKHVLLHAIIIVLDVVRGTARANGQDRATPPRVGARL